MIIKGFAEQPYICAYCKSGIDTGQAMDAILVVHKVPVQRYNDKREITRSCVGTATIDHYHPICLEEKLCAPSDAGPARDALIVREVDHARSESLRDPLARQLVQCECGYTGTLFPAIPEPWQYGCPNCERMYFFRKNPDGGNPIATVYTGWPLVEVDIENVLYYHEAPKEPEE